VAETANNLTNPTAKALIDGREGNGGSWFKEKPDVCLQRSAFALSLP